MRDRYLSPTPEQNEPDFRIISGYQNVTSTIQEDLSFSAMSSPEMVIKAMQYGLANPNLQRNLQFEGNPALLPR